MLNQPLTCEEDFWIILGCRTAWHGSFNKAKHLKRLIFWFVSKPDRLDKKTNKKKNNGSKLFSISFRMVNENLKNGHMKT